MIYPITAIAVAFLISLFLTPICRRLAIRLGMVDFPDSHRKLHREPIALCGGLVLLMSLFGTLTIFFLGSQGYWLILRERWFEAISLGLGAIAIVGLGLLDDRFTLRGRQKLFGQILICLSIIGFGFTIDSLGILGVTCPLGLLAIPVTLGWLLLSINSVNLIDGADGLCSSIGWIAFAALAAIGWYTGNHMESMIAASMAGALLGFLIYNLPPAKVFLGDAGSMLVGLILGVLAMRSWIKDANTVALATPVVLMAIPLFDSSMAIIRRKLTGRSVFTVDRGHLHHNLIRFGIKNRSLVGVIMLLSFVTASGAVLGVIFKSDAISLMTMAFALGSLVATRVFGFAEFELAYKRGLNFAKTLVVTRNNPDHRINQQQVRIQGSLQWEKIWETMVEFAEKHHLAKVRLDLNMPWLHEGFHASWHKNRMPDAAERWHVALPVVSDDRILGRIEAIGQHQAANTFAVMSSLAEMLEELQPSIRMVVNSFEPKKPIEKSIPFPNVDFGRKDALEDSIPVLQPVRFQTVETN
jgi:UDP-GlcNAc:undecaprenyl-phosphate/decaprenyl-phosphate GlcNAc-1-phosphate transferase